MHLKNYIALNHSFEKHVHAYVYAHFLNLNIYTHTALYIFNNNLKTKKETTDKSVFYKNIYFLSINITFTYTILVYISYHYNILLWY